MVVFLSPQQDVLIDTAPELIDEAHPSLYNAVIAGEYALQYMSKDFRGKDAIHALRKE